MSHAGSSDDALTTQLARSRARWAVRQSHGVTPKTPLELDGSSKNRGSAARALAALLQREAPCRAQASRTPGGLGRRAQWSVSGTTAPTLVDEAFLEQWITWMVAAGTRTGCVFDGWGAQVPAA